jgi:hypothetical protein
MRAPVSSTAGSSTWLIACSKSIATLRRVRAPYGWRHMSMERGSLPRAPCANQCAGGADSGRSAAASGSLLPDEQSGSHSSATNSSDTNLATIAAMVDVGPIARRRVAAYSGTPDEQCREGHTIKRLWAQLTRLPPLAVRGRGLAEKLGILRGRSHAVAVASVPRTTRRSERDVTTKPTVSGQD